MRMTMLLVLLAAQAVPCFAGGSPQVVVFQDSFSGAISSAWQIQKGDTSLYSVGANGITLRCSAGDMWILTLHNDEYKNLFLITNPAPGDFICTVKCQWQSPPTNEFGQVALVAYDDDGDYVRVDNVGNNNGTMFLESFATIAGVMSSPDYYCKKNFGTSPFWLQMRKQLTNYSSWFSTDGINFTQTNSPFGYPNGHPAKLGFVAMADPGQSGLVLVSSFTVAEPSPGSLSLQLNNGKAGLQLTGTAGATYQVQFTTGLSSMNWTTLTNLALPSSPYPYLDPTPVRNNAAGFYRAVLVP